MSKKMTDVAIIKNILDDDATPIGVLDSGETFGLKQEDRNGNMFLLGRSGFGRSVLLENIVVSDIVKSRGGLLIDPYGDLIDHISDYADENTVIKFEVSKGDVKFNNDKFDQEVDLSEIKNNKFILCKLNYSLVGNHGAREIGLHILEKFYNLGNASKGSSLFIDEFHNFINVDVERNILNNKECGIRCVIADQQIGYYSDDSLQQILGGLDHAICFNVDAKTSKKLAEKFEFDVENLKTAEKFNFYANLTIDGQRTGVLKAKSIFPIPYPKTKG